MRAAIGVLLAQVAVSLGSAAAVAATDPGPVHAPKAAAEQGADEAPLELVVTTGQSKLLRTKADIYRTQVGAPGVCDVLQFTPRSLSVVGKKAGTTNVTVWLKDGGHKPVRLLVRVVGE